MTTLTLAEVAYHASVHPELDFHFSFGRLHISRSPTIKRLAGKGDYFWQSPHTKVAACQPSDLKVI